MDSKVKAKLKEFLINGQVQQALAFIELLETYDGNYTTSQRNATWKYMTMKADQLNEAGLDMRKVLKPTFNIPWTKDSVHDFLWIPIQKALFKTSSMKALKKMQVSKIYEVIERELGEKHGLDSIEFPNDPDKAKEENQGYKTGGKVDYPTEEYKEPLI